MTMTEILFTGDLFLGGDLHSEKARDVVRSINFHTADKRIVNLEQPISDNNKVADCSPSIVTVCFLGMPASLCRSINIFISG